MTVTNFILLMLSADLEELKILYRFPYSNGVKYLRNVIRVGRRYTMRVKAVANLNRATALGGTQIKLEAAAIVLLRRRKSWHWLIN